MILKSKIAYDTLRNNMHLRYMAKHQGIANISYKINKKDAGSKNIYRIWIADGNEMVRG